MIKVHPPERLVLKLANDIVIAIEYTFFINTISQNKRQNTILLCDQNVDHALTQLPARVIIKFYKFCRTFFSHHNVILTMVADAKE